MPLPQKSDEELIRLICSEDKAKQNEAAAYLTTYFRAAVERMVAIMTNGRIDEGIILDDSVMDLMKAVRNGNYRRGKGSLERYFRGICKINILSAVRDNDRRKEQDEKFKHHKKRTRNEKENAPDQPLLNEESREMTVEALKKLPPACRELLERYWIKGELLKDIAEDMNKTEDAAKKQHQRCREKLKKILGKDPFEP